MNVTESPGSNPPYTQIVTGMALIVGGLYLGAFALGITSKTTLPPANSQEVTTANSQALTARLSPQVIAGAKATYNLSQHSLIPAHKNSRVTDQSVSVYVAEENTPSPPGVDPFITERVQTREVKSYEGKDGTSVHTSTSSFGLSADKKGLHSRISLVREDTPSVNLHAIFWGSVFAVATIGTSYLLLAKPS